MKVWVVHRDRYYEYTERIYSTLEGAEEYVRLTTEWKAREPDDIHTIEWEEWYDSGDALGWSSSDEYIIREWEVL